MLKRTRQRALRIMNDGRWHIFDPTTYHFEWKYRHIKGILNSLLRDFRYAKQRVQRGYCDGDTAYMTNWFLSVIPEMIQSIRTNRCGDPVEAETLDQKLNSEACETECGRVMDRMVFLFREANEATCSMKNQYDREWQEAYSEFEEKYGMFGEKLLQPGEITEAGTVIHFPSELPEYKDICEKHRTEDQKITQYRDACKKEALQMFGDWLYDLYY